MQSVMVSQRVHTELNKRNLELKLRGPPGLTGFYVRNCLQGMNIDTSVYT